MSTKKNATSFGGESGNKGKPGPGQPKGNVNALYLKVMRDKALKAENLRRLDKALLSEDDHVFLKAWKECADRGFGTPRQSIEHSGPDQGPIPVVLLPPEE